MTTTRKYFSFALSGLLAGLAATLALGLCSVATFPGIVRFSNMTGTLLGIPLVVVFMLQVASLPALLGGLLGGRIPREGGPRDQVRMAAFCGALVSLPFDCFILWSLTGR